MGVITDRDTAVRHVADAHGEDCTVATHMSRDNIEAASLCLIQRPAKTERAPRIMRKR